MCLFWGAGWNPQTFIDHRNQPLNVGKYTIVPWILSDKLNPNIHTVDGRNPAPPGMYKTLYIMG